MLHVFLPFVYVRGRGNRAGLGTEPPWTSITLDLNHLEAKCKRNDTDQKAYLGHYFRRLPALWLSWCGHCIRLKWIPHSNRQTKLNLNSQPLYRFTHSSQNTSGCVLFTNTTLFLIDSCTEKLKWQKYPKIGTFERSAILKLIRKAQNSHILEYLSKSWDCIN